MTLVPINSLCLLHIPPQSPILFIDLFFLQNASLVSSITGKLQLYLSSFFAYASAVLHCAIDIRHKLPVWIVRNYLVNFAIRRE